MKHLALLISGLAACLATPALSAQRPVKAIKLPTQCSGFGNSQQAAACYTAQLETARTSLQAIITDIKAKGKFAPDASITKTFDSAHDFWVKEMNLTCKGVEQFYEGGTLAQAEPIRCELEMTRAREQLLRSLYQTVLKN
jgi:uncharacterized protein YecT (DUF1311 family)